jgi:hypothetical protein
MSDSHSNKTPIIMKKIRLLSGVLLLVTVSACNKYDHDYRQSNDDRSQSNSSGNAANIVGSTLAKDADGIVNLVADVTLSAQSMVNAHSACGTIKSDSSSRQSTSGATTTYNYLTNSQLTVLCNSNSQADSALNVATYSGNFSNANLTSSNSGSSTFNIGGILASATNYTVDGEYKRSGNYQYNTGTKSTVTSSTDIVLNKLLVNKPYRGIVGGTATFTITGTNTVGTTANTNGNYSYAGTLTFNNTNYATLTLNGTSYKVNLITGAITTS